MVNIAQRGKALSRARGAAWRKGLRIQRGRGMGDVFTAADNSRFAQEISKKFITKGVNSIPSLFKKETKKIKNKHLRKMAQSEIMSDIVDESTKRLYSGIGLQIWLEYQILQLRKL